MRRLFSNQVRVADEVLYLADGDVTALIKQHGARAAGHLLTDALLSAPLDLAEPMYLSGVTAYSEMHRTHTLTLTLDVAVVDRALEALPGSGDQPALPAPRKEIRP